MKQSNLKILISLIMFFVVNICFAQYKTTEAVATLFVENNKKNLSDFVKNIKSETKIMVLPFLNESKQIDEFSNSIAKEISAKLQLEYKDNKNVVFFVKDEFSHIGMAELADLAIYPEDPLYWKTLLEKMKPKYYVEGYYNINTNNLNQEFLNLKYANLKTYVFDVDKTSLKISLNDASSVLNSADKTVDIKTDNFIWAEGTSTYYEGAEKVSLENLMSKIAASVQSKFMLIKPKDTEILEFTKKIINTYSNSISEKLQSKVVTDEPGSCVMIKYISKDVLAYLFDEREILIRDYLQLGIIAEKEFRIGDALRNYYRALIILQSHQDYATMHYDFGNGDVVLKTALTERIKSIFNKLEITVTSVENLTATNTNYYLQMKYNTVKIQNIVYKYWNGNSYSSPVSASNGNGLVEIYGAGAASTEKIKCRIEYMFSTDQDDFIYNELLECVTPPVFSESEISVNVKSLNISNIASQALPDFSNVVKQDLTKESETKTNVTNNNSKVTNSENKSTETTADILDTDKAAEKVKTVCEAITTKNYESVKDLFTTEGYDMFIKLAKYGNAKVLNFNTKFDLVELNDYKNFRSVSMQFTFGKKIMLENVNFNFDKDNKINSLAFAMSETSTQDIMKTSWTDYDKYEILNFMENYQTAYNLERLEFINSIFSENALIIVGHVLKTAPTDLKPATLNQNIEYDKMDKTEYLARLQKSFANNEFVNVHFEGTDVKQGKLEHVYGIQLSQDYSSTTYSDKGYLFLLIDLRDPAKPLIHVRTWQPEKSLDGSIFGVDDFYFD